MYRRRRRGGGKKGVREREESKIEGKAQKCRKNMETKLRDNTRRSERWR